MFQLTIIEKGGETRRETFDKAEVTVGRVQGNDVILPKGNISKRHSRITYKDDKFVIVDLKSTNGTYVNGKKISAPQVVKTSDKIYIGDFTLQLQPEASDVPSVRDDGFDLFGGPEERGGREGSRSAPALIEDSFDGDSGVKSAPPRPADSPMELAPAEAGGGFDFGSALDPAPPSDHGFDPDPSFDADPSFEAEPGFEPDAVFEPEPSPVPASARSMSPGAEDRDPAALDPSVIEPALEPAFEPLEEETAGLTEPPPADAGAFDPPAPQAAVEPSSPFGAAPEPPAADFALDAPARSSDVASDASAAEAAPNARAAEAAPVPSPAVEAAPSSYGASSSDRAPASPTFEPTPRGGALVEPVEVERWLHGLVVDELGLREVPLAELDGHRDEAERAARRHAARLRDAGVIAAGEDLEALVARVARLATDLGFLSELLVDGSVLELVITPDRQVLVDRDGGFDPAPLGLPREAAVIDGIRQLAVLGGVEPTDVGPVVDVRLRNGARVVATLPPVSFRGPSLTIRRPEKDRLDFEKLVQFAALSRPMVAFIELCIRHRRPILVVGGPGLSPAATLNAILERLPADDRVVTVENGVELDAFDDRVVTALQPGPEADTRLLVELAARLHADRLVVADLRGVTEAVFDATSGATSGAAYALAAASPEAALAQLVAELEGAGVPAPEARVADGVPVIVFEEQLADGSRRFARVGEVSFEDGALRVEDVFRFQPDGMDGQGRITGHFAATGFVPRFVEARRAGGDDDFDPSIFEARG